MSLNKASWRVCSICLRQAPRSCHIGQRRALTTANPLPPPDAGYAQLTSRRLISLHGDEAPKYLQGLTAANIPRSTRDRSAGFYSCFLNAQGRVLYDAFIYPTQPAEQQHGFFIEVDANEAESLYKHLKRYKLRAKVNLRLIDVGELGVWSAWGQEVKLQEKATIDDRIPRHAPQPNMGSRFLLSSREKPHINAEEVSCATYDVRRTTLGVPEGQQEILKESALPQESDIDYMGGIDFRKGCYVGQELTIRTHHTGVVRKRILPVQLYGQREHVPESISYDDGSDLQLPPAGANISRADKKGRSAGRWLGGVGNIGLALCRLEIMTDTALTGEGSQWSSDAEFKIAWEGQAAADKHEVRIKAFVPWWHAVRAEEQKVRRPNG